MKTENNILTQGIGLFFHVEYISVSCASKSYNRNNYKYRKRSSACSIYLHFGTRNQVSIFSYTPVIRYLGYPVQITGCPNPSQQLFYDTLQLRCKYNFK